MSRLYEAYIEIEGYKRNRKKQIITACAEEWDFEREDFCEDPSFNPKTRKRLTATAQGNLCAGEMEDEFADRLASAVWKANRRYCQVTVHAACLEYLPYETCVRDEDDYKKWKKKDKKRGNNATGRSN